MNRYWRWVRGYFIWLNLLLAAGWAMEYFARELPARTLLDNVTLGSEIEAAIIVCALFCAAMRNFEAWRVSRTENSN